MRIDNIIYNHKFCTKNEYKDNIDKCVYVLKDLFDDDNWIKYANSLNIKYYGVMRFILEMSFITNLAYTYHYYKRTEYEISPDYFWSLIHNITKETYSINNPRNQRTRYFFRNPRILDNYVVLKSTGYRLNNIEEKWDYVWSKYTVTDKLINLASDIDKKEFVLINLKDIEYYSDRSTKETRIDLKHLSKKYITSDGKEYKSVSYRKEYDETDVKKLSYGERLILKLGNPKIVSYSEFDKETYCIQPKNIDEFTQCDLSNEVKINRNYIRDVIYDIDAYVKYKSCVIDELKRIYFTTSDSYPYYNLNYYQTNEGRYYIKGSTFQHFPKELRNNILSDYCELDIKCSIFSILKNLAETYNYKGSIKQISHIVNDPVGYRNMFVNENISYDEVKTVLTAISFGATMSIWNMCSEYFTGSFIHTSSLMHCGVSQRAVINMCSDERIRFLYEELHSLIKTIINKNTNKSNKVITNVLGKELLREKGVSFGKKLAHIYQGYESLILTKIKDLVINGKKLCEYKAGIGLYLHDGVYIKRDVIQNVDICALASEKIYKDLGFKIDYELKQ